MTATMPCPKCAGTGRVLDPRETGNEMRQMREKRRVSVHEMARRLNLSAPYISDLELGRRAFNAGLIQRYKAALK